MISANWSPDLRAGKGYCEEEISVFGASEIPDQYLPIYSTSTKLF
ncbi:hypothetical protein AB1K32_13525 [Metabacillus dongyingensis]